MCGFGIAFMCLTPSVIPSLLLEMATSKGATSGPTQTVSDIRQMGKAGKLVFGGPRVGHSEKFPSSQAQFFHAYSFHLLNPFFT